jgi:hypothetical protein
MEIRKRPSQGTIDMMNGGWEKLEEERKKNISWEPIYIGKMEKFFTKLLILEITSRNGLRTWRNEYKTLLKNIKDSYDYLSYNNYCKYMRLKYKQ